VSLIGLSCLDTILIFITDISYWKAEVGTLGFIKEVAGATLTGGVANTGVLREMKEDEIAEARKNDSGLSA